MSNPATPSNNAIDANKVSEMLKKFKNQLNKTGNKKQDNSRITFKVSEEQQKIRILYYPFLELPAPFIGVKMHFNVEGKSYYCPTNDGDECPFCEMTAEIYNGVNQAREENPEADVKLALSVANKVRAKTRFYVPVVQRLKNGGSENHVRYWSIGSETQDDIIRLFTDEDMGIIFDFDYGQDIKVTGKEEKMEGNKSYLKAHLLPTMVKGPVFQTQEEIDKLIVQIENPIKALGLNSNVETYTDLKKILEAWEAGGWKTDFVKTYKKNTNSNGGNENYSKSNDKNSEPAHEDSDSSSDDSENSPLDLVNNEVKSAPAQSPVASSTEPAKPSTDWRASIDAIKAKHQVS